jgi:hypothetical protein
MDPSSHYPEPFGEAASYSSQRATQLVSLVAAAAEVRMRLNAARIARRATQDRQVQRQLDEQERTARANARAGWAPAHDARWLAQADVPQAFRTWGAAVPWADTDPVAASAMRKSEERLRTLHPFAMARYDRLRAKGAEPLDAMRQAAPLFGYHPNARPAGHRPMPGIEAPADATPEPEATDGTLPGPEPEPDPYQDGEHRGRRIAERLRAQALYERGAELTPDELAVALEQTTSLPPEVIARLARARSEESTAESADRARAADLGHASAATATSEHAGDLAAARHDTQAADTAGTHAASDRRTAVQLAAENFPRTAADGIRAAVAGRLQQPAPSPARTAIASDARRPGLPR